MLITSALLVTATAIAAAPNDWAEGTPDRDNGATRDYYNRASQLEWKHRLSNWRDIDDVSQGNAPYAAATVTAAHQGKSVEWTFRVADARKKLHWIYPS